MLRLRPASIKVRGFHESAGRPEMWVQRDRPARLAAKVSASVQLTGYRSDGDRKEKFHPPNHVKFRWRYFRRVTLAPELDALQRALDGEAA